MIFNPKRHRETAMIDFLINTEYDPDSPMGNVALCDINMDYCWRKICVGT